MSKLYVIVRRDLSIPQQAVQAGHAVAKLILENLATAWSGTLVYLGIDSEETLNLWGDKLTQRGIDWTGFREPDIGNQLTAIAAVDEGKVFSNLKLL
jgi:hypothetical protein